MAVCYLESNNWWYVQKRHDLFTFKKDYQSLRTEWVTGQKMTATIARDVEKQDSHESQDDRIRKLNEERYQSERHVHVVNPPTEQHPPKQLEAPDELFKR